LPLIKLVQETKHSLFLQNLVPSDNRPAQYRVTALFTFLWHILPICALKYYCYYLYQTITAHLKRTKNN